MKYYVATYDDNWADEMDIYALCFIDEKGKAEIDEDIRQYEQAKADNGLCDEYYVGTNQYMDPNYVSMPSFKEISESTYIEMKKVLGDSFGDFPCFGEFIEEDYWEEHFEE